MTNFLLGGDEQGAVVVEESESVVVGDQGGGDVEEGASDAVVDGDGEGVEANDLEISCENIDFGLYVIASVLTFSPLSLAPCRHISISISGAVCFEFSFGSVDFLF